MAQSVRSNGTKKKNNKKRQSKQEEFRFDDGIRSEIILCIVLVVSILLLLSNFGIGGIIGNAISSFSFGMIGTLAYIFPFVLFFGAAFCIANKKNRLLVRKLIGIGMILLFTSILLQLILCGYHKGTPLIFYYKESADTKIGGGFIGGIFSAMFASAFGLIGTYVITIAGIVIGAIIITQKPLVSQLKEKSTVALEKAKAKHKKSKETTFYVDETDLKKETTKYVLSENNASDILINHEEESTVFVTNDIQLDPIESVVEEVQEEPFEKKPRVTKSSKEEIENNIADIKEEIALEPKKTEKTYKLPPLKLLSTPMRGTGNSDQDLRETALILQQTLHSFGVEATVTNASCGPKVTRYELQPDKGVKVSKIVGLADDIKLNLAATDIRIEAPIPGKAAIGIEVPNKKKVPVVLRELLQSDAYVRSNASIPFAVGKDIAGNAVVVDIAKMPHLLIAGATGSGKSVCINTLIMSILYKANPDEIKLIMIDPKVVELSVYNGIPHLLIPVVTDPKKAAGALNWAVAEMTERYNIFADFNVRDLKSYNEKAKMMIADTDIPEEDKPKLLPKIVIIVDELADLMMVAPGEAEDAICRLAQLARACGIHLIIATQRPSVNVITGLIKANMPSRIAFSVTSGVDSRTILDMQGAEKLLGEGDMLFYPQGYPKPARMQGAYISDAEVNAIVKYIVSQRDGVVYNNEIEKKINTVGAAGGVSNNGSEKDAYFVDAGRFIIEKDKASIGMLQRVFKIGFNRAARIMDQLCEAGVVGEEEGTKPRKVLMSMEQFEQVIEDLL